MRGSVIFGTFSVIVEVFKQHFFAKVGPMEAFYAKINLVKLIRSYKGSIKLNLREKKSSEHL